MEISVIGASGYTGKELYVFLNKHAKVDEVKLYGNRSAGQMVWSIFPELKQFVPNQKIKSINEITYSSDLYFLAMPHGQSLALVEKLLSRNLKIIDLSADYRLDDASLAKKVYDLEYQNKLVLTDKLYGLCEAEDYDSYKNKQIIANPGCYPTATLLSLFPLYRQFSERIQNVSTVTYSGSSGAGKKANEELLLSEMENNVKAYQVLKHRHEPEIKQELLKYGNIVIPYTITMHLLPIKRGYLYKFYCFSKKTD